MATKYFNTNTLLSVVYDRHQSEHLTLTDSTVGKLSVVDPVFPKREWASNPNVEPNFFQKLHENERN